MTKLQVINNVEALHKIQAMGATTEINSDGNCVYKLDGEEIFYLQLHANSETKLTTVMNRVVAITDGYMTSMITVVGMDMYANINSTVVCEAIAELTDSGAIASIEVDRAIDVDDPIAFLISSGVMFHLAVEGQRKINLPNDVTCTVAEGVEVLCYNREVLFELPGGEAIQNVFTFTKKGVL